MLAVLVLAGGPLGWLVKGVVDGGWPAIRDAFTGPGSGAAVRHSLVIGVGSTLLAVPVAVALAFVTERSAVPWRRALRVGIVAPLLVPAFVLGYSWEQAYGKGGLTDHAVGVWLPGLEGRAGVVVVQAVVAMPLAYLVIASALASRAEPDLERAARACGASGLRALATVTLPLLRGAIVAAAALVFADAMAGFAIPAVLGMPAGYATMTTRMYEALALSGSDREFSEAIALGLGLVVIVSVLLLPVERYLRPARAPRTATAHAAAGRGRTGRNPTGSSPTGRSPGELAGRVALPVVSVYVVLASVVPLVALVLASVTRAVGLSPSPANWTFAHYRTAMAGPTPSALTTSAVLAVTTAVVLVPLGWLLAWRERRPGGRLLSVAVLVGFALPGSGLAIGVLLAYGRWLDGSIAIILLAYLAKFWAVAHRPISGGFDTVPPDLGRAARAAGAGPVTAWRTASLPALARPACAAAALVFLLSFHELTMSSLLYGPGTQTLAVVTLNLQQLGDVGATAALAVVLTLIGAVGGALLWLAGYLVSVANRRRSALPARGLDATTEAAHGAGVAA